ncbi:hypothetical protein GCM10009007_11570 [Formosimonas limnophila]|uniref:Tetratricopeptide repeat protein n=1 Tax=Formosimonas limnophila TaxID=1384487 RepID=A0A8J3FZA1_9BURK|nr:tetratricopeptide repeat protein [Formosimonas limnophila]GHA72282.1 hypothetical protein GCM10009007_11570 [Formosimonas limnophila]
MKKTLTHFICMAAFGLMSAAHAQETVTPQPKYNLPQQKLTADIMFGQLISDFALSRGLLADAYSGYRQLAMKTKDPRYAERALDVARLAGDREAAMQAALLLQSLAPNSPIGRDISVGKSFEQVQKNYKDGNYPAAYDNLKTILKVNPDQPMALLMMGDVADQLGKQTEARAALTRLVQVSPKDAEALNALGYFLADKGIDLEQARLHIEHAHDLNPDAPHIIDSLAWVAYRQNRLDEAVEWINQVADSKQVEVQVHRGEILWVANQKDLAIAAFQKARQIESKNPMLINTLKRLNIDPKTIQ